jgi:hypothetical protein
MVNTFVVELSTKFNSTSLGGVLTRTGRRACCWPAPRKLRRIPQYLFLFGLDG